MTRIKHINNILWPACKYTVLLLIVLLVSCNNVKYLPKGEKLYTGAEVKIACIDGTMAKKKKKALEKELTDLTRPKPNTKLFGGRLKLWIYNRTGTPKGKGLRYLIRTKLGEPPVFFSKVNPKHNEEILKNHLENRGYFMAEVFAIPKDDNKGRVSVTYNVKLSQPYTIRKVIFPVKDSSINKMVAGTKSETYLKTGSLYNLDTLKLERERIKTSMKEQGLFYFTSDDIIFKVDSTAGTHQVDIYVQLKKRIPTSSTRIYYLNNIYVFADHSLFQDTFKKKPDTIKVQGYYYITSYQAYRPSVIVSSIFLQKDSLYNFEDYDITLNRLMRLGIYKFVNIKFKDLDTFKTKGKLDTYIYLTALPRKSLRTELRLVSKSDNFAGPLLNISFKNRNVFKGAETLTFNVNGSISTIITGSGKGLTSSTVGADAILSIPKFVIPLVDLNPATKFVPKTEVRLGFQKLSEIRYYNLNTFSLSAGYHWNQNERKEHILNPIVINFLKLGNTSSTFDSILNRNISLKRSFATQFVIGSNYSYIYNTQVTPGRKFDIYFNGTVDVAGNLLGIIQYPFENHAPSPSNPYKVLGEPYSQYVLGSVDLRHYWNISKEQRFVSRVFAGAGLPYGNSGTLPYIKEFFTGGNNSVRAFPSRFLGPGSYQIPEDRVNAFFIDQVGDMKLEGNLEYRFPIAGVLKGAVFTDAGNIWLIHNDTARPGGQFNINTFYKQIAVGTGIGLRIDASFFVLRFDVAFPLRKAYPTDGDYWVINAIRPLDPVWRNKNLVLNIGIGYPF